jgi:hypothetical protein
LTALGPISEDVRAIRKSADENVPPTRRTKDYFVKFLIDDAEFQEKKRNIVSDTATWIFDEKAYINVLIFSCH